MSLIRLQCIYNFWLFHAIILPLLDVYGLYFKHLYHFWDYPTNRRPSLYCCFLPISVFRRKGTSNGVQTEWNLQERDFWNEHDPEDLQCKSRSSWGSHEIGWRALCLVGPSGIHWRTSSSYISLRTPKTSREDPKHNFHRRNHLYPQDLILEPSPALCRRGNWPRWASTSTP